MKKKTKTNKKENKLEQKFLKTTLGKAMFIVLAIGIITIILSFGTAIFEGFLYLTNKNIFDYSLLINLGITSGIIGLTCNLIYLIVYTNYKKKNI